MSKKWLVTFADAGNCEIAQVEVECAFPYNAPKVAVRQLDGDTEVKVIKECVQVTVHPK